mgnify:FL=1
MTEVYKTPISQLNAALKWNSENKEYMCDYVKKWNLNHPERAKATYKRTYEKNKEERLRKKKEKYHEMKRKKLEVNLE